MGRQRQHLVVLQQTGERDRRGSLAGDAFAASQEIETQGRFRLLQPGRDEIRAVEIVGEPYAVQAARRDVDADAVVKDQETIKRGAKGGVLRRKVRRMRIEKGELIGFACGGVSGKQCIGERNTGGSNRESGSGRSAHEQRDPIHLSSRRRFRGHPVACPRKFPVGQPVKLYSLVDAGYSVPRNIKADGSPAEKIVMRSWPADDMG